MPRRIIPILLTSILLPAIGGAAEPDFVPLFNGRDLSGWVNVNCAPNTFTVRDGLIISTGIPTGVIRTGRQYENFILELEWRHIKPGGNAGLFVWSDALTAPGVPFTRSIEVQILDGVNTGNYTSHGDVFAIHGATLKPDRPHPAGWERCLPSEQRARPAGQWNHYRVECNDGALKLSVNGKQVSGATRCSPRKGYICLEAEGSECHFRNLRIKELPSTSPRPDQIATLDQGFRPLYTGIDLAGWQADARHLAHWQPRDWILSYDARGQAQDKNLWSEKEYGDFVLICDWRSTATTDPRPPEIDLPVAVRGGASPRLRIDKPITQWNRFIITMKGPHLTVDLNGKVVIDNARLADVPARGRIALRHHDQPVDFANLHIKELDGP